MMHYQIRQANTDDVAAIVLLMQSYYVEDGYQFDEARASENIARFLREPALGVMLVATNEIETAAYIAVLLSFSFEFGGMAASVDEVYVTSTLRGQGIGRACLEAALVWCRQNEVTSIHLEVEQSKFGARWLYQQLGFVESDRVLMSMALVEQH